MRPRPDNPRPELTHAARKHLLRVACTVDRLRIHAAWAPPVATGRSVLALLNSPMAGVVLSAIAGFLPRKLRLALSVWRALQAK